MVEFTNGHITWIIRLWREWIGGWTCRGGGLLRLCLEYSNEDKVERTVVNWAVDPKYLFYPETPSIECVVPSPASNHNIGECRMPICYSP